jgi:PPOX class probable F420-dependent enzyme
MAFHFDEKTRRLLDAKNFATLATVNADGSPQTSVVWFARENDSVVMTAASHRKKVHNLERDPRASLSIFDLENPYETIEIRGRVELLPDPDKHLPHDLSQRYLGEEPPPEPGVKRVTIKVVPEKVNYFKA